MKSWSRCLIVLIAGSVLAGCGNNDNDVARVQQPPYQPQQQQQPYQPPYDQQQQVQQQQYGQPQYQQAPAQQPVIVNQAPASSGVGDMLMGGALGYMLGSSGNNSSQVRERVVERHVQAPQPVAQSAPRQQYQQPQAAPLPKQPTYSGWSKPAATQQPVAQKQPTYSGWSKPAVSKPSTPTRSSYSGFSKRR